MNIPAALQQAIVALQAGDHARASDTLQRVLAASPRHADALHLMALVAKQRGRLLEALGHFKASLAAQPLQPVVLSNLGNLLQDLKRFDEAEQCYRRAVELMPGLADAWFNRGVMASDRLQTELALECLQHARAIKADARTLLALGRACLAAGRPGDALSAAEEMRRLAPAEGRSVVLQARALRALGREAEARALLADPGLPAHERATVDLELGLWALDAGAHEEATFRLEAALQARPDLIEAHRALNSVYWERQDGRFLSSYRRALHQLPDCGPLYHNLAAAHISSGDAEAATRVLEDAVRRVGRDPFLVHGLGVQAMKRQDLAGAESLLDEALAASPDHVRFLVDRANLDLRRGDYADAAGRLERALQVAPANQEVWAYRGLLWRLTGDERHDWLNDYDLLLREYQLPVPEGFPGLDEFMAALAGHLAGRHTAVREPLDQSVRGGTQTTGVLLDEPHPLLQALRRSVECCVRDYLSSMPKDASHPFLSRGGRSFRFAGSWSVSLRSQGYHANHVHPYGWLSCCNYVSLPDVVGAAPGDRAGWIRFGETSLALGDRERVARAIRPRAGHCVFFPGYFWHGTYPFESAQRRVTVPCDFDPA